MYQKLRRGAAALSALLLLCLPACSREEAPASSSGMVFTSSAASSSTAASTQPTQTPIQTASPTGAPTDRPTKKTTAATTTIAPTTAVPTTAEDHVVTVTIPEGKTMVEIFRLLEQKGVASYSDLMKAAQTYDFTQNTEFDYSLLKAQADNGRCYKLEGYLFPSTYEFYKKGYGRTEDAIGKLLRTSEQRFTKEMRAKGEALGFTPDEILTIASLIQAEGAKASEMANISAVIHNRLKAGMKLELDATKNYVENDIDGNKEPYRALYNTYKCAALPAGPIGNPGTAAINAALNPADVDYLFFCTSHEDPPKYYYATTYEEHKENLKKAGLVAEEESAS